MSVLLNVDAIDIVGGLRPEDEESQLDLCWSMKTLGLIHPITVMENPEIPGRFIVLAGRRRLLAARRLAWGQIHCTVVVADPIRGEQIEIAENLHRKEYSSIERAQKVSRFTELHALQNPEYAAALEARRSRNLKNAKAVEHAEAVKDMPGPVEATARKMGVSVSTVRQAQQRARKYEVFDGEQAAVLAAKRVKATQVDRIAEIDDAGARAGVVNLLAAGMAYPEAMREVLGDRFEGPGDGDEPGEEALSDEDWLRTCPIRNRVNQTMFDADALLYRKAARARVAFARAVGWAQLKGELGARGVYFTRMGRFLGVVHPRDWVQCHDCTRGQTPDGPHRACHGGGYLLG